MDQKLSKLINYFRLYSYSQETTSTDIASQSDTKSLQQCISKAKTIIELFEQKINLLQVENQSLSQQNQHLKITILQDKLQTEKVLEKEKLIAEELRKQLMEKDYESRILTERIQQLQIIQADQLVEIKNQETQHATMYEDKIHQQKTKYEDLIEQLNQKLQSERLINESLKDNIRLLTQQLNQIAQQNAQLCQNTQNLVKKDNHHDQQSSHQKNYHQFSPQPTTTLNQPFIPSLQIVNSQQPYPTASQDQILNYSYEQHPTALKDVLNFSGCNSSRFNLRQFMRTKQKDKENLDDNVRIDGTNSSKKLYMSNERRRLDMSAGSKEEKSLKNVRNSFKIQQFSTATQSTLDPYYVFFALTAQCIKINSEYFEEIAEIDIVDKEWDYVINQRVPMNLWAGHLQKALMQQIIH